MQPEDFPDMGKSDGHIENHNLVDQSGFSKKELPEISSKNIINLDAFSNSSPGADISAKEMMEENDEMMNPGSDNDDELVMTKHDYKPGTDMTMKVQEEMDAKERTDQDQRAKELCRAEEETGAQGDDARLDRKEEDNMKKRRRNKKEIIEKNKEIWKRITEKVRRNNVTRRNTAEDEEKMTKEEPLTNNTPDIKGNWKPMMMKDDQKRNYKGKPWIQTKLNFNGGKQI